MTQRAVNSMGVLQNIKDSLLKFTYSQNPGQPQNFQIPPEHLDNIKNFVLNSNISTKEIFQTLFSQNQLQNSGFDPDFKIPTESNSDNEDDNDSTL